MGDDRLIRDTVIFGYTYAWARSLGIFAGLAFLVYAIGFIALLLGAVLLLIAVVWLIKNRRRVWRFTKKFFIGLFKLVYWTVKLPVMTIYWAIRLSLTVMLFVSEFIGTTIALLIAGAYYVYERVRYA